MESLRKLPVTGEIEEESSPDEIKEREIKEREMIVRMLAVFHSCQHAFLDKLFKSFYLARSLCNIVKILTIHHLFTSIPFSLGIS